MYAYHQNCYEAHERIKRREREAESERKVRSQRQKRRRAAPLGLLIARRRATGLELDT